MGPFLETRSLLMRKLWLRSLGQVLTGYDWHPYEKGNLDTETNTHTGETSYDDEGRDQEEVSTSQGMPEIATKLRGKRSKVLLKVLRRN